VPGGDIYFVLFWYSLPGDPLGTYQITASQGDLQVVSPFTEEATPRPVLLVEPPQGQLTLPLAFVAGSTFAVGLAGFKPGATVGVYVYMESQPGPYTFLTALSVPVNTAGQALFQFVTGVDDALGNYCLV